MTEAKILIVDDEAHIRLLIEQALEELEDEGVELFTAGNGEDALQIIVDEHPNLVFLDVMMPRKNGFEVCHTVKKEMGLTDIYIVMLTAKGQEVDRHHGEAVGADI
ncbi:MAG: response regulator, partial [Chloroflexota bacterium]